MLREREAVKDDFTLEPLEILEILGGPPANDALSDDEREQEALQEIGEGADLFDDPDLFDEEDEEDED